MVLQVLEERRLTHKVNLGFSLCKWLKQNMRKFDDNLYEQA